MIDFRIERGWSFDGHQMWIIEYRNGKTYIAKPFEIEFVELPERCGLPEPTLKIQGPLARELLLQIRKAVAGYHQLDDKEDYENSKRVEKAMQAHIDSLKLVVDRTIITRARKL